MHLWLWEGWMPLAAVMTITTDNVNLIRQLDHSDLASIQYILDASRSTDIPLGQPPPETELTLNMMLRLSPLMEQRSIRGNCVSQSVQKSHLEEDMEEAEI